MKANKGKISSERVKALFAVWLYVILLILLYLFLEITTTPSESKYIPLPDNGILFEVDEMQDDIEQSAPSNATPPPPAQVEEPGEYLSRPDEPDAVIEKKQKKVKPKINKALLFSVNKGKGTPDVEYNSNSKGKDAGTTTDAKENSTSKLHNFTLNGRNVVGGLPKPQYDSNREGRVVISIHVNQKGEITNATFEARTSTTNDSRLVAAAIVAAKKVKFNADDAAAHTQAGTITYNFTVIR